MKQIWVMTKTEIRRGNTYGHTTTRVFANVEKMHEAIHFAEIDLSEEDEFRKVIGAYDMDYSDSEGKGVWLCYASDKYTIEIRGKKYEIEY